MQRIKCSTRCAFMPRVHCCVQATWLDCHSFLQQPVPRNTYNARPSACKSACQGRMLTACRGNYFMLRACKPPSRATCMQATWPLGHARGLDGQPHVQHTSDVLYCDTRAMHSCVCTMHASHVAMLQAQPIKPVHASCQPHACKPPAPCITAISCIRQAWPHLMARARRP